MRIGAGDQCFSDPYEATKYIVANWYTDAPRVIETSSGHALCQYMAGDPQSEEIGSVYFVCREPNGTPVSYSEPMPFEFQPCAKFDYTDSFELSWLVAGCWAAAWAVSYLARLLR